MKEVFYQFRAFVLRGNIIDLAIGVIIGSAFGKIVSSFIEDVITPLLLKPALEAAHLSRIEQLTVFGGVRYGLFLSALINFLIVALVLFLMIQAVQRIQKKEAAQPAAPSGPTSEQLLSEIRDLLKK
jgi:large conductance mechanosensitive channel